MTAAAISGTLFLLPAPLGDAAPAPVMPQLACDTARRLEHFIAENPKSARAFLRQLAYPRPLSAAKIAVLDKNTPAAAIPALLAPLVQGSDAGLLSEAGCPAVADPGALLVRAAHRQGIRVVPLVGPSSILLALMASGLNGQRFAFHGYLPRDPAARSLRLRELERRSRLDDATQIFIETPYRNDAMLQALLADCAPQTLLCVATDLTQPGERIITRSIAAWRADPAAPGRRPSVFLLYCDGPASRVT